MEKKTVICPKCLRIREVKEETIISFCPACQTIMNPFYVKETKHETLLN